MRARIVCLPGDGTGPEIIAEAVNVLTSVACAFDHSFTFVEEKFGSASTKVFGTPFGEKAAASCRSSDAVLLGFAADPIKKTLQEMNLKSGLSLLQKELGLYAGIQYHTIPPAPASVSPLKEDLAEGLNLLLVWPLSGGAVPPSGAEAYEQQAVDTFYSDAVMAEHTIRLAFHLARERRKSVCGVFSGEMNAADALWMETASRVLREFPDVHLRYLLGDACAATMVKNPKKFDVLLAGPLMYRPLSGIAAGIQGSFGLVPGVLVGERTPNVYLPAQGFDTSPADQDMANPVAMILSTALMLRKSLHLYNEADCLEMAVKNVLDAGWRTADLVSGSSPRVGTQAIGKLIAEQVDTAGAVMGAIR